jgi:minor extracellular protease Epr
VLVAAAGNGGPAAAPAYPAAYPGVIAVTAVDEQGRVYRRANRGGYIAFAAGGVHVENRYSKASSATVSGTSFAAPRVAAEIASRLAAQPRPEVQQVLDRLHSEAVDLGEAGRDPVYGWGWLR